MAREKEIEELAEAIFHNCNCGLFFSEAEQIARFVIDEQGYRKQEWTSVDERLPTEQEEVLAYYGFDNGKGDLGMMFMGVLPYFYHDKKPHFHHEDLRLRVTHWMPLPEDPKMKGGEGK